MLEDVIDGSMADVDAALSSHPIADDCEIIRHFDNCSFAELLRLPAWIHGDFDRSGQVFLPENLRGNGNAGACCK